ncbi:hypothetical protein CONPUDRAFT_160364 [Coniophora puteana RWD-64-598 SS2]|uniref:F-box domain-containing protein n=1 Tax=Coniophora puteana (strain RWD-64-598) TaxID=741705 RepID=R7SE22_CONPW|nr:uncharacterized protein CONPUDRAFT_160364 [Coniophora puteana RWD-64-598 SS2]EIW74110.1 hypothetical protein CONPUDRAFT_160364 [Coniophora puteana RWD-64-598 SS2]
MSLVQNIFRALTESEWMHLQAYTDRIRVLRHDATSPTIPIDNSAFTFLSHTRAANVKLFSGLRSVSWNDSCTSSAWTMFNRWLPLEIQAIDITLPSSPTSGVYADEFVSTQARAWIGTLHSFSQVQCLILRHDPLDPNDHDYKDDISPEVMAMAGLSELRCGSVNEIAIRCLLERPCMRRLDITLPAQSNADAFCNLEVTSSLNHISLRSLSSLDQAGGFINALQFLPEELSIVAPCLPHEQFVALLLRLAQRYSRTDHQRFGLSFEGIPFPVIVDDWILDDNAFIPTITLQDVQPLISDKLQHLVIEDYMPIDLSDNDVTALARGLPSIITLSICGKSGSRPLTNLSLNAVVAVLESCRRITALGLVFDAKKVPSVGASGNGLSPPVNHSLKKLLVGNSEIEDPPNVGFFLKAHAPELTIFTCSPNSLWYRHSNIARIDAASTEHSERRTIM